MWQYQNTDELYHHGVLGMRWGHRKVKTKNQSSNKKKKDKSQSLYKETLRLSKTSTEKIKKMSDDDFSKYLDKITKNINELKKEELSRAKTKKGKKIVEHFFETGIKDELSNAMAKRYGY